MIFPLKSALFRLKAEWLRHHRPVTRHQDESHRGPRRDGGEGVRRGQDVLLHNLPKIHEETR
jgi:hypothetical protein